jgi:cobaltochelatase CobN
LSVASKTVNGDAPDMYINNMRKSGAESLSDLRSWLASELNARNWNEKWLTEMQRSGYAGAREMAREVEYLYGFQATSAEQMSGTFWQNTYDVFVADKHGLGLDQFFNRENPFAQQSIAARLLEVDRQGSYRFSDDERANLVRMYVESVARHGISCSANTCGNLQVNQYAAAQAPLVEGLGNERLERFGLRVARATGWTERDFAAAPSALKQGIREASRPGIDAPVPSQAEAPSPPPEVSGFKIEEKIASVARATTPLEAWPYVLMALLVAAGVLLESRKRAFDR